jgi:hypothetical protein
MFAAKAEEHDRGLKFVLVNPIFELKVDGEGWGYGTHDGRFWPLELAGDRTCETTLPKLSHISVQWPVSEEKRFREHVDGEMRTMIQIMKGLKKREVSNLCPVESADWLFCLFFRGLTGLAGSSRYIPPCGDTLT